MAHVREAIEYEAPLAADHFGRLSVDDCIRLGHAAEPHKLAWLEDIVLWERYTGFENYYRCY